MGGDFQNPGKAQVKSATDETTFWQSVADVVTSTLYDVRNTLTSSTISEERNDVVLRTKFKVALHGSVAIL